MRLRTVLPLTFCAAILTACSSNAPTINNDADFMDASAYEMLKTLPQFYQTKYFALGIPEGWKVVAFNNLDLDSYLSVQSLDRSSTITIRVRSSTNTVEESCELAKSAFLANDAHFINEPGVKFGTCTVEAEENGKSNVLWLRNYNDDNSSYSINIAGPMEKAGEILRYLVGNEKMMQLLVRPL